MKPVLIPHPIVKLIAKGLRKPTLMACAMFGALTCVCSTSTAYDFRFERRTVDTSRDDDFSSILTLAQDSNGYIWIGTEYGLARYDGQRTTRYPLGQQSDGTYVNDLLMDNESNLWVATERGVGRYMETEDRFEMIRPFPHSASMNRIAAIAVDHQNIIVMARPNGISLFDPKRRIFRHYDLPGDLNVDVGEVHVDQNNNIWLGTFGEGAALFDQRSNRFTFYQNDPDDPNSIGDNHITRITEDNLGRLWFGTKTAGISRLTPGQRTFVQFKEDPNNDKSLGHNYIRDIFVDSEGYLWVATDHGGLSRFDDATGHFTHFKHNAFDNHSLASNQVRKILEDREGDLWVATYPSGLNYFNRKATQFKNYSHHPDDPTSLSNSAILSFLEDRKGRLWVGTENGLNQYLPQTDSFKRFEPHPTADNALRAGAVITMVEDHKDNIWLGTWSGGLHRFNPESNTIVNYLPSQKHNAIPSAFIWALVFDRHNQLWVGTEGEGLLLYREETNDFKQFKKNNSGNSINHNYIWSMLEDHTGQIWIGTTAGLNRFDPETETFFNFPREPGNASTVDAERIRALFQDSQNRIWVGTQEAGLFIYDYTTQKFTRLTPDDGLPAYFVTGFVEDDEGYVWVSTVNGAVRVHPTSLEMTLFNENHGLAGDNLYRSAALKLKNGEILLGGTDGFSAFNPRQVSQYPADDTVFFTHIETPYSSQGGHSVSKPKLQIVEGKHTLALEYFHSVMHLEFSALNYRGGNNLRYNYKLKGFDERWIELNHANSVTYTNLSPGHYTFLVRSGTLAGWSPRISTLDIHIAPPPWRTWWAYTLYSLAALSFFGFILQSKAKQLQLKGEREVNSQLRNLNAMKDAFLANTSHELRTPLNGIIGIAECLKDRETNRDGYTQRNLELIISSGKRLSALINDILDYSKLANHKLVLNPKPVDVYHLVQNVLILLDPIAKSNDIELVNDVKHLAPFVFGDENRLQQILINLVGNSIKYTAKGSVRVSFKLDNERGYITVKDTGIGISKDKQSSIFDAFNQAEGDTARHYDGTGLGLAITKLLVELHEGHIWVESTPGHGSTFTFTIPAAEEKDSKPRPIPRDLRAPKALTPSAPEIEPEQVAPGSQIPRNAKYHTLLVVDDDSVNRLVLSGMLAQHEYNIIEARSGADAIEIVRNQSIDLVVMDVMMPAMTGYEACRIIRKLFDLHELPVIFLTAKTGEDEIAACFDAGGSDYLPKPVSKHALLARIANHLRILAAVRKLQMGLRSDTSHEQ